MKYEDKHPNQPTGYNTKTTKRFNSLIYSLPLPVRGYQ